MTLCHGWKVKHSERGVAVGTPLWTNPAYSLGKPYGWIVFPQIPKKQLEAALSASGISVIAQKALLDPDCCHTETLVVYVPTEK